PPLEPAKYGARTAFRPSAKAAYIGALRRLQRLKESANLRGFAGPVAILLWSIKSSCAWAHGARLVRALRCRSTLLMLGALAALSLPNCKPTAGSSCEKGEARCLDAKRELVCQAGRFIESPCNGPGGCLQTDKGTSCDFSGNKPGDPCSADDEGAATCRSKDGMLACHGGVYAFVPCRGARG